MRELHSTFKYKNVKLIVIISEGCDNCFFDNGNVSICIDNPTFIGGLCSKGERDDGIPVIFVRNNNFRYGK